MYSFAYLPYVYDVLKPPTFSCFSEEASKFFNVLYDCFPAISFPSTFTLFGTKHYPQSELISEVSLLSAEIYNGNYSYLPASPILKLAKKCPRRPLLFLFETSYLWRYI